MKKLLENILGVTKTAELYRVSRDAYFDLVSGFITPAEFKAEINENGQYLSTQELDDIETMLGIVIDPAMNPALSLSNLEDVADQDGTYDDYAPGIIDTINGYNIVTTGSVTLTGLEAPTSTDLVTRLLVNGGTKDLKLSHENTISLIGNRFCLPNDADLTVKDHGSIVVYYNVVNSRWMVYNIIA